MIMQLVQQLQMRNASKNGGLDSACVIEQMGMMGNISQDQSCARPDQLKYINDASVTHALVIELTQEVAR